MMQVKELEMKVITSFLSGVGIYVTIYRASINRGSNWIEGNNKWTMINLLV